LKKNKLLGKGKKSLVNRKKETDIWKEETVDSLDWQEQPQLGEIFTEKKME